MVQETFGVSNVMTTNLGEMLPMSFRSRPAIVGLLFASFASVASAQLITPAPSCADIIKEATYRMPPLTYPMTSDRYAVQYKLDGADWTDAQVHISYYGGTNASPLVNIPGYTPYTSETSMSFVSISVPPGTGVQLRVTKLWDAPFLNSDG